LDSPESPHRLSQIQISNNKSHFQTFSEKYLSKQNFIAIFKRQFKTAEMPKKPEIILIF